VCGYIRLANNYDYYGIIRKISSGGYLDERAQTYVYNELSPIIQKYLD